MKEESKKPKKSKDSPDEELARVFEYMKVQNRPYITNDIWLNMGKAIGKAQLARILDQLADEGKLLKKQYSKSLVYCINQGFSTFLKSDSKNKKKDLLPVPPTEELAEMEVSIKAKEEQLRELKNVLKQRKKVKVERDSILVCFKLWKLFFK